MNVRTPSNYPLPNRQTAAPTGSVGPERLTTPPTRAVALGDVAVAPLGDQLATQPPLVVDEAKWVTWLRRKMWQ